MEIKNIKAETRCLKDLEEVIFDQEWLKENLRLNPVLYYLYRDLAENKKDRQLIVENNLRYDITVMPAYKLGKEFVKTLGHDHPFAPKANLTYPEIYEVLEGQAIFLLQDSKNDKIKDVYVIKARENDKIIVPPNYEHLIINPSPLTLKTCNWVCREFSSNIYKPFRAKHGFCYFALSENNEVIWKKNENYQEIPKIRFIEAERMLKQFNLSPDKKIYEFISEPRKLDFLKNPQNYSWGN